MPCRFHIALPIVLCHLARTAGVAEFAGLPAWGAGGHLHVPDAERLIESLVLQEYLAEDRVMGGGGFCNIRLRPGAKSRSFSGPVLISFRHKSRAAKATSSPVDIRAFHRLTPDQEDALFKKLVLLRNLILSELKDGSRLQGAMAAHHVFPDSTLLEIARVVPETPPDLLKMEGIGTRTASAAAYARPSPRCYACLCRVAGQMRYDKWGMRFFNVIQSYLAMSGARPKPWPSAAELAVAAAAAGSHDTGSVASVPKARQPKRPAAAGAAKDKAAATKKRSPSAAGGAGGAGGAGPSAKSAAVSKPSSDGPVRAMIPSAVRR